MRRRAFLASPLAALPIAAPAAPMVALGVDITHSVRVGAFCIRASSEQMLQRMLCQFHDSERAGAHAQAAFDVLADDEARAALPAVRRAIWSTQ